MLVPISRGISSAAYWEAILDDAIEIGSMAADTPDNQLTPNRIFWQQPTNEQRFRIDQVRHVNFVFIQNKIRAEILHLCIRT